LEKGNGTGWNAVIKGPSAILKYLKQPKPTQVLLTEMNRVIEGAVISYSYQRDRLISGRATLFRGGERPREGH
jgi:hypothetical protein